MDYSKKPRCYMLMIDVDYFGEIIPRGTVYYNFSDLDTFTPCLVGYDNIPILHLDKTLNFKTVKGNHCFCEVPLIKEYLNKLNFFLK